jgi:hypothetical protein
VSRCHVATSQTLLRRARRSIIVRILRSIIGLAGRARWSTSPGVDRRHCRVTPFAQRAGLRQHRARSHEWIVSGAPPDSRRALARVPRRRRELADSPSCADVHPCRGRRATRRRAHGTRPLTTPASHGVRARALREVPCAFACVVGPETQPPRSPRRLSVCATRKTTWRNAASAVPRELRCCAAGDKCVDTLSAVPLEAVSGRFRFAPSSRERTCRSR